MNTADFSTRTATAQKNESAQAPDLHAAWLALRNAIIGRALSFSDHLIFDFRLLLTDPYWAREAGQLLWIALRQFEPQVLIGPGFGAAPLLFATAAAALADGVHLPTLMVRDKRKAHNQKRWVEGPRQAAHSRAIVIDDFMKNGSALALVEQALAADGHVLNLVAIGLFFDMWQPLGSRQIATGRMPVVALFKRHDIGLSRDCFDAQPPHMTGSFAPFIDEQPLWWRFALNDKPGYPLKCAPVIADDAVFAADDHCKVWRHNGASGAIEWRYDCLADPLKGIVQKLQYADGSLVFGCYDGTLTRLNASSGQVIWRWRLDSSIHATPELDLARQRLFINTEQWNQGQPFGHLQALDWSSGKLLWRTRHAWWPPGSPIYAAQTNAVYATCNDQSVSAVHADDGTILWRKPTRGLVRGKPAVHGDKLLLATEKGWLQCLHLHTGELIWQQRYGRGEMHQFLQIYAGTVITLDGHWQLIAFDIQSGAIRWMSRLRSAGNWCPIACGESESGAPYWAVLSREGHLAVFDPEREIKVWEGTTGMTCRQPPAAGRIGADLCLAVASNSQGLKLYKINAQYSSSADQHP